MKTIFVSIASVIIGVVAILLFSLVGLAITEVIKGLINIYPTLGMFVFGFLAFVCGRLLYAVFFEDK